jgi:hypothetical protein
LMLLMRSWMIGLNITASNLKSAASVNFFKFRYFDLN